MGFKQRIQAKLEERKQQNAFRQLTVKPGLTDFCSNDYLGITRDAALQQQVKDALLHHDNLLGSGGSRLLSGNSIMHEEFEQFCADYFKGEAVLYFNSGYSANLSLFSALPQKGDTILLDEHIHACIKEGARLSFARKLSFKHNDLADLERKLSKAEGQCFIGIESIYSMDGDTPPVEEMVSLAKSFDACLIVDEAHSTGLCAEDGSGWMSQKGLSTTPNLIRVMTFGKAVGYHGAAIIAPGYIKDFLINFARPFIYTTAPPSHDALILKTILIHIRSTPSLQNKLEQRIRWFRSALGAKAISSSAIQPVIIGGNETTKQLAGDLITKGFDVRPVLSPTVARGSERLRICLHTHNTREEIDQLAQAILKYSGKH